MYFHTWAGMPHHLLPSNSDCWTSVCPPYATFVPSWPICFSAPRLTFGLNNFPFSSAHTATASSPSPQPACILQRTWSFTLPAETSQAFLAVLHRNDSSSPLVISAHITSPSSWLNSYVSNGDNVHRIARRGFRFGTMKSISGARVKTPLIAYSFSYITPAGLESEWMKSMMPSGYNYSFPTRKLLVYRGFISISLQVLLFC